MTSPLSAADLRFARSILNDPHSTPKAREIAENAIKSAEAVAELALPKASREAIDRAFGSGEPTSGAGKQRVQGGFVSEFVEMSPAAAATRLAELEGRTR